MRHLFCAAIAAVAVGPAAAADVIQSKPIDTTNLVVKPSRAVANLTAAGINLVGNTAASQIENDGYVKTLNNLFKRTIYLATPTQAGPSALPAPGVFSSTKYKNYNTPQMPIAVPARR